MKIRIHVCTAGVNEQLIPVYQDFALLFVANRHNRSTEPTLFENPETAKYVLRVFPNINGQMDDCTRAVEKQSSPEELKAFKRGVGHVMYEVFERVVEPICKRHPTLRPPEMEGQYPSFRFAFTRQVTLTR